MSTVVARGAQERELWVHRWGGSVSEVALLDTSQFFELADVEGFIGYRVELGCAIVFGDPICLEGDEFLLAEAFQKFCDESQLIPIYIAVSERFAEWAFQNICQVMIEVGEELIFNPQNDPTAGHSKLRYKINHAKHKGLQAHEYQPLDLQAEEAMQAVVDAWLGSRKGPQMFLGPVDLFKNQFDTRWFYVEHEGIFIGVALISKLEKRQGWLLKYSFARPEAPRGTSELLMNFILETLRSEGCQFLTYGIVPADELHVIKGLSVFSTWCARYLFKTIKWIFKLNQRKLYWQKFDLRTEPTFALFKTHLSLPQIQAVIKSLK